MPARPSQPCLFVQGGACDINSLEKPKLNPTQEKPKDGLDRFSIEEQEKKCRFNWNDQLKPFQWGDRRSAMMWWNKLVYFVPR